MTLTPDASTQALEYAAIRYARKGWHIFPTRGASDPANAKLPLPGLKWRDESTTDPKQLAAWFCGTNYGLGVDCGKSGLVVLDADDTSAITEDWDLGNAWVLSGHPDRRAYVFNMPDGAEIGCSKGLWVAGEVRGVGGYFIAPPSYHAVGGAYLWMPPFGSREMPDSVRAKLVEVARSKTSGVGVSEDVWLTPGEPDSLVARAWAKRLVQLKSGSGRHDAALHGMYELACLGAEGHSGVKVALSDLEQTFYAVTSGDQGRDSRAEWKRMCEDLKVKVLQPLVIDLTDSVTGDSNEVDLGLSDSEREIGVSVTGVTGVTPIGSTPVTVTSNEDDLGDSQEDDLYVDVAAVLSGGKLVRKTPRLLKRADGHCLLYAGKVNVLFGDKETGKTWIAYAAAVEALGNGHKVLIVDVDHNGPNEVLKRLQDLGATFAVLGNRDRFRFAEPDDKERLSKVIQDALKWGPAVVVVDSIGEVMPMLGLASNSADDYTIAHRFALSPFAAQGAAVIAIDHMSRGKRSRKFGQTGSEAKGRAINGASIKVTLKDAYVIGRGGSSQLTVWKDRPGGVRINCPSSKLHPSCGVFKLVSESEALRWEIESPSDDAGFERDTSEIDDVERLRSLNPAPRSIADVRDRMGWGTDRASRAMRQLKR